MGVPTAGHVNGVVVEYVVTKQRAGAKSSEQGCLILVFVADVMERYVVVVVMVVVMVESERGY